MSAKIGCVMLLSMMVLTGCGRSKDAQFYVLNPLVVLKQQKIVTPTLHIGIDAVNMPAYLEKTQFALNYTPHHLALEEYNLWAEPLNKNIVRVIKTNLSNLLLGSVVEVAPWDSHFKPNYQLRINITQFTVNVAGESVLRAECLLYKDEHIIKKVSLQYGDTLQKINTENLVINMNNHINRLSIDIAQLFKR